MNAIYETVPEKPETDESERASIELFFKDHQDTWIKARDICVKTGLTTKGTSVKLRNLITELICIDKCPIVGGHMGFCWTNQPNMIDHYIEEDLKARIRGIERRITALEHTADTMRSGKITQYTLPGSSHCACGQALRKGELLCKWCVELQKKVKA